MLTGISFIPHVVERSDTGFVVYQTALSDLDNDGDLDVVSTSWRDGGIDVAWYEYLDGQFSRKSILDRIEPENGLQTWTTAVASADLDEDGRQDLIVSTHDRAFWYQNLGDGVFSARRLIAETGLGTIKLDDFDGDGDTDVIGHGNGRILWIENEGSLNFAVRTVGEDIFGSVALGDFDGDGDLDVVTRNSTETNTRLVLLENRNTELVKTTVTELPAVLGPGELVLSDFDGDGDLDAVVTESDNGNVQTHWIENSRGVFGDAILIGKTRAFGVKLQAVDIDGDSDNDIVMGHLWYENIDGATSFVEHSASGPSGISGDIDNDGDIDLLLFSPDEEMFIVWYENTNGKGLFQPRIVATERLFTLDLSTADLDGDGDQDILYASNGIDSESLGWYRNEGGGRFSTQRRITFSTVFPTTVFPTGSIRGADLDGDGDVDVLAPSCFRGLGQNESFCGIAWYENLDGMGSFSEPRVIQHDIPPVLAIGVDIEGDGDTDVVAVSEGGDVYFVRQTGSGNFDPPAAMDIYDDFTTDRDYPHIKSLFATDVDGNGVPEFVTFESIEQSMGYWFGEYDVQQGTFPDPQQEVSLFDEGTRPNHIVDLDGDGDFDRVYFSYELEQLVWLENDGTALVDQPILIADSSTSSHFSLSYVADMDGDGDSDIVSSTDFGIITWHESRLTGDANDDGDVDFADFLALSRNFGKQVDAVWEDGDFNLDGSVSFEDFLLLSSNFGSRRTTD